MKNSKKSKIVIHMRHIDNASRFARRLKTFCKIADEGGDAELLIRHNGEVKNCGFVAHDLSVRRVVHKI